MDPRLKKLVQALQQAKRIKPIRQDEINPGKLTNENGPQVQTNYPPNAWPEDGDHS